MSSFWETYKQAILYTIIVVSIVLLLLFLTQLFHNWLAKRYRRKHPNEEPSTIHLIQKILNALWIVLGFMAGDKPLMDALGKNISPHAVSASSAFSIPIETFDKKKYPDQYAKGKELNFANVFGAGFETLYYRVNRFSDEKYRVTREELHTILNTWRKKHFAIVEYKQRELDKINRQGYVDTPFGHRRYVDAGKGNANTLFNTIMQSSSGLVILLSIVLAFEEIEKQNALDEFPFCFDIHDAEIFEFPREYQDQIERLTLQKTIEAANYMGMPTIGSEVDIYPERFGFK